MPSTVTVAGSAMIPSGSSILTSASWTESEKFRATTSTSVAPPEPRERRVGTSASRRCMPSSFVHARKAAISARSAIPASTAPAVRSGSTPKPLPFFEATRAVSSTCSPGFCPRGAVTVNVAVRVCFAGTVPRAPSPRTLQPRGTSSATVVAGRALPGEPSSTVTSKGTAGSTAKVSDVTSSEVPRGSPPLMGSVAPSRAAVPELVGSASGAREAIRVNQVAGIFAGSAGDGGFTCQPWVR